MKKNGETWSRPLFVLPKYYIPLYEKLREELFVPDDLNTALSTFPDRFPRYRGHSQFLYSLNDTFILTFSIGRQSFIVITEQGTMFLQPNSLFGVESAGKRHLPYTGELLSLDFPRLLVLNEFVGSALVRFERSTIPDHKGTRTVVLRFLKIITPVECVIPHYAGKIVQPEEGELHRRMRKTVPLVWSIDIDKDESVRARGLQLLWDAN